MSERTAPNPPPPEMDTGYYGPLPVQRHRYRILTNGVTFRVQVKRLFLFWDTVTTEDSRERAERWIAEQIRRNTRTAGPWRQP